MTTLKSTLDTSSEPYRDAAAAAESKLADLDVELGKALAGGGEKYVDRHRKRGKMTARERVEALIDEDSPFLELCSLAGYGSAPQVVTLAAGQHATNVNFGLAPITEFSYCASPSLAIPDNNPTGVSTQLMVTDGDILAGITCSVNVTHTWKGDLVLVYHTGKEKAVAGLARVASAPKPDATDPAGKALAVDLVPVAAAATPVTLAAIKADPRFADLALVRIPRLSVMPVAEDAWRALLAAAGLPADA